MKRVMRDWRGVQLLSFCALFFLMSLTTQAGMFAQASGGSRVYNFDIFTTNGGFDYTENAEFSVDVHNGAGEAKFTIYNNSTVGGVITAIYFDNGTLLDLASIDYTLSSSNMGADLEFEQPATPQNLPSGNMLTPPFETSINEAGAAEYFAVDSSSPNPIQRGIGSGEYLTIVFDLIDAGMEIQEVWDAIVLGGDPGGLRIGLHIQSFDDALSTSQSAVNEIPEPATIGLLAVGGLLALRRRKK